MDNLENEIRDLEREDAERTHQILVAAAAGSIVGWVIGVSQLVFIGSWALVYWAYVPMIPLYSALGWALFGMVVGASGILGKPKSKAAETEKSGGKVHAA